MFNMQSYVTINVHSQHVIHITLMLHLTKWCKKTEKWLKPCYMGTHMRILSQSYPIKNQNDMVLDVFQRSLHPCTSDESSLNISRVNTISQYHSKLHGIFDSREGVLSLYFPTNGKHLGMNGHNLLTVFPVLIHRNSVKCFKKDVLLWSIINNCIFDFRMSATFLLIWFPNSFIQGIHILKLFLNFYFITDK